MPREFYESDRARAEYLLFHYGKPDEVLPFAFGPAEALGFPIRCVAECLDTHPLPPNARALDLGCAVGRSSFELARHCAEVIGIDASNCFIETARALQKDAAIDFEFVEEGNLTNPARAVVPPEINRQRVTFEVGDAQNLRGDLGKFEVVLLANLIDRLREPLRCLRQMPGLLKSGGQLIVTSPYTWLEEFTRCENWLGGFERDGALVATRETLHSILSPDFESRGAKNLPFLIREHARKYQWSIAEATLWVKR